MDHNETRDNKKRFDKRELMEDGDDDIGDLEDYLIQKDPPYYVNEEEERSKGIRCKLLRIPYVKPPTCKTEKFKLCWYQDAFTTYILAHVRNMEDHTEQFSREFSVLIL
ncbi:hypothetical protein Tco_0970311 [Tanacetum coccineum]